MTDGRTQANGRFKSIQIVASIWLVFSSTVAATLATETDEKDRADAVTRMRGWTDSQLEDRLSALLFCETKSDEASFFCEHVEYEPCLSEIVRRETPALAKRLETLLDRLEATRFKYGADGEHFLSGSDMNLELLTALRRLRRQPDPLTVVVNNPNSLLTTTPLTLPHLEVSIRNMDIEKRNVGFQHGGNYRSGRQTRWRIDVTDAKGTLLRPRNRYGFVVIGGGQSYQRPLGPGETWNTTLDVRRFIATPLPGRYTVQVLYHNTRTIANESDITGLIVTKSKSFPMTVTKHAIELTPSDQRAAKALIAKLPEGAALKVVAGSYGPWAHRFVPPDSTAGRLLSMRMKGVPTMIDALDSDNISSNQRAWILSLLFSATGEHDPRLSEGFANYEYIEGPWQVWGGNADGAQSGGIVFASTGASQGVEADASELVRFSRRWQPWLRKYCDVRSPAHSK